MLAVYALGCVLANGPSYAAELLTDPGFEASTGIEANPHWTLDGSVLDPGSYPLVFFDGAFANHTPGGDYGVWFQSFEAGATAIDGSVQQIVPGVQGGNYELSAYFKVEPNFAAANLFLSLQFIDAAMASLLELSVDVLDTHPMDSTWLQYTLSGIAPAATDSIVVRAEMIDGTNAVANPQSALLDDLSLTLLAQPQPVPEPVMAGLFGLGITALCCLRRRRQRL